MCPEGRGVIFQLWTLIVIITSEIITATETQPETKVNKETAPAPLILNKPTRDALIFVLTNQSFMKDLSPSSIAMLTSFVLDMSDEAPLKDEITKKCPRFEEFLNGSATLWRNLTEAKDLKDGMDVVTNSAKTSFLSISECASKLLSDVVIKVTDYLYAKNITQPPSTSLGENEITLLKLIANVSSSANSPVVYKSNTFVPEDQLELSPKHGVKINPKFKQQYENLPKPSTNFKKKPKGRKRRNAVRED